MCCFVKQKTSYEMRISDWSSDVCSSDLDLARTSDPRIVAAGDCASHRMARYDRLVRLESVPSAGEQAKTAAATLCGKERPIAALPWFWSAQYDLTLQIAGFHLGYDETGLRGAPSRDPDFTCYNPQQNRTT